MEKCFICGEESYKCEMSSYKVNEDKKELICAECRNDQKQV
jgi:hypothetical protein